MNGLPAWAEEPGLSQVSCECGGETFIFLLSSQAARLLCSLCGKLTGEFARTSPN